MDEDKRCLTINSIQEGIMNCPFQPMGEHVLMLPEMQAKTAGGLLLPKSEQDKRKFFIVAAVGPDVGTVVDVGSLHQRTIPKFNVGDKVAPPLNPYEFSTMPHEGKDWYITKASGITMKVLG